MSYHGALWLVQICAWARTPGVGLVQNLLLNEQPRPIGMHWLPLEQDEAHSWPGAEHAPIEPPDQTAQALLLTLPHTPLWHTP